MKTDPAAAADKWSRKVSAASQDYIAGVQAVQTAPGQLAAKNQAALLGNFQEAVNSGRWARKVSAVSLQDWQSQATNVGAPRLASGATKGKPKMQAFMTNFLPFEQNVVNQVKNSMPRGTLEQNIARATAVMQGLAGYKNKG